MDFLNAMDFERLYLGNRLRYRGEIKQDFKRTLFSIIWTNLDHEIFNFFFSTSYWKIKKFSFVILRTIEWQFVVLM